MAVKKYAVIGNPIAHSKSPLIHQAFAKAHGIELTYERVLADTTPTGFSEKVHALIQDGFSGANVTVPFKFDAFAIATPTARAQAAGAINTLSFDANGQIRGDNTDGVGMVRDIERNCGFAIAGKRVLLVGAGGAARGVLQPLLASQPASLTITNRTLASATSMAESGRAFVAAHSPTRELSVSAFGFSELANQTFDLVINSTSSGLDNQYPAGLPHTLYQEGGLAYDMMYGRETPFMQIAKAHHANVADGLGMLVEQAAEAFMIWHGVLPQTAQVMADIRSGVLA